MAESSIDWLMVPLEKVDDTEVSIGHDIGGVSADHPVVEIRIANLKRVREKADLLGCLKHNVKSTRRFRETNFPLFIAQLSRTSWLSYFAARTPDLAVPLLTSHIQKAISRRRN